MDNGLNELKKGKVDVALLKKSIDGTKATQIARSGSTQTKIKVPVVNVAATARKKPTAVAQKVASAQQRNGNYAVQVGAFKEYKRAQNHALNMKNKLAKNFAVYSTAVEKVPASKGYMYRSKIVGLSKNDAVKICQNMKRQKQSCLVVAETSSMKVAQK